MTSGAVTEVIAHVELPCLPRLPHRNLGSLPGSSWHDVWAPEYGMRHAMPNSIECHAQTGGPGSAHLF